MGSAKGGGGGGGGQRVVWLRRGNAANMYERPTRASSAAEWAAGSSNCHATASSRDNSLAARVPWCMCSPSGPGRHASSLVISSFRPWIDRAVHSPRHCLYAFMVPLIDKQDLVAAALAVSSTVCVRLLLRQLSIYSTSLATPATKCIDYLWTLCSLGRHRHPSPCGASPPGSTGPLLIHMAIVYPALD